MTNFQAVIFDMDGTLIEPLLDFAEIRRVLGIHPQAGILESLDTLAPAQRQAAHKQLLGFELAAAQRAKLMPGAVEAVSAIREAGLKTALLTRNAPEAMAAVLHRFPQVAFDLTWSRENGPIKPEPDGILRACSELGVKPQQTACVGDFHYDITAASDAGAVSILLVTGERPSFADEANHVINSLNQLPEVLGI